MMPGARQHRMTPQQQQHHFEQQMWNEQLMFMQMMNSRGGAYKRQGTPSRNGGGKPPANNTEVLPMRSGTKTNRARINRTLTKPSRVQNNKVRRTPESPGVVDKQAHQDRDKEAKEKEAAANKNRRELERSLRHSEMKKATQNNRGLLASDQSTISLLKNAEMKLRRADHDYAGHRVQAIRHVAHALNHMTGSYPFNESGVYGTGNLPQGQSDGLLREAEGHLRTIENTLRTRTNSLEHHQNARASVADAIRELHAALRVN